MILTLRPITTWPGVETPAYDRRQSQFKATYSTTLTKLELELEKLDAYAPVVELWVTDRDIRVDGQLRAGTRPEKPGVILSFESKHGPLRYACDLFVAPPWKGHSEHWHHNLRAIVLGLEALRRIERYGIASRAEQYTGWKALPSGIAIGQQQRPHFDSAHEAAEFLIEHGESDRYEGAPIDSVELMDGPLAEDIRALYYKRAAMRLHPDQGGDDELFTRLGEARRILDERAHR